MEIIRTILEDSKRLEVDILSIILLRIDLYLAKKLHYKLAFEVRERKVLKWRLD